MENEKNRSTIVGLRFSPIGKSYYFDATSIEETKVGQFLVVETSRGWQLGQLTQILGENDIDKNMQYKAVDRIANEADLKKKKYLDEKAEKALEFTRKRLSIKEINGVKMVSAEFSFDESSLTFLYSTENDSHINFNSIIKEIRNEFQIGKVDFHKIGPRDVAKYYCGMGACGLENRCCSQFINKFDSISIRMAKTQGISLTPSDITGMCNRLRCCLSYEYCTYVEALKEMPKRKKKVNTPFGVGVVKDLAPISKTVFVSIPEHGVKELSLEEIEEITPAGNPSQKQQKNTGEKSPKRPERNRNKNRRGRQPPKNTNK